MTRESTIGNLIEALIDYRGKTPPKTPSGVPLITAKVIKGGTIMSEPREYIAEDSYDSWMRRGLPASGDILITTEAPLGEVARVGADSRIALAQRVILLRPDASLVDPSFMFHYLRSPKAQAALGRRSSGTTVSGIRQPELRAVEVPLLARPAQEMVGAVLDSIDALIENNRRRVEVLEEMARAIYREWFVKFRYPGHEDVPLVDSALGPIPEGWTTGRLGDLAVEIRDSVKPSDATRDIPYVPIDEIDQRSLTLHRSRPGGDGASSLRLFKKGDILFGAMRAYFHKVCVAPFDGVTRSTCFVLRGKPQWRILPAFYLDDDETVAYASNHSSGSTIPYAKWEGVLIDRRVALPPSQVGDAFSDAAEPMLAQARGLAQQAAELVSLRDLLLPKLVTGKIDVSQLDLDALVEGAVA